MYLKNLYFITRMFFKISINKYLQIKLVGSVAVMSKCLTDAINYEFHQSLFAQQISQLHFASQFYKKLEGLDIDHENEINCLKIVFKQKSHKSKFSYENKFDTRKCRNFSIILFDTCDNSKSIIVRYTHNTDKLIFLISR